MKNLPDKIIIALARYYHNRLEANKESARRGLESIQWLINGNVSYSTKTEKTWDKDKDTDHIFDVAKKLGWDSYRVAGTFFFTYESAYYRTDIQCDEKNYLDGGVKKCKKISKELVS